MPDVYIEKLLKFIASELESTRHVHFYLLWIETILTKRGSQINTALQMPVLLMLQKNMQKKYDDLSKMLVLLYILNYILSSIKHWINLECYFCRCDFNQYTINYILS